MPKWREEYHTFCRACELCWDRVWWLGFWLGFALAALIFGTAFTLSVIQRN